MKVLIRVKGAQIKKRQGSQQVTLKQTARKLETAKGTFCPTDVL